MRAAADLWRDLPLHPEGEPYYQVAVDVHRLTTPDELRFLDYARSLAESLYEQWRVFDMRWVPMLLGRYPLRHDLVDGRIQLLRVGVACVLAVARFTELLGWVAWHRNTDVPMRYAGLDIRGRIQLLNELLIETVFRCFQDECYGRESWPRLSLIIEDRLRSLRDLSTIPGLDGRFSGRPMGQPSEQERGGEYACWGFGFVAGSKVCTPCTYAVSCAPACTPVRRKTR